MTEPVKDNTCPAPQTEPIYPTAQLKEASLYIRIRLKERPDKTVESTVTQFEIANYEGLITNVPAFLGDFDTRYNLEKMCENAVKYCQ